MDILVTFLKMLPLVPILFAGLLIYICLTEVNNG